jgi:hypothetical protein
MIGLVVELPGIPRAWYLPKCARGRNSFVPKRRTPGGGNQNPAFGAEDLALEFQFLDFEKKASFCAGFSDAVANDSPMCGGHGFFTIERFRKLPCGRFMGLPDLQSREGESRRDINPNRPALNEAKEEEKSEPHETKAGIDTKKVAA